MVNLHHGWLLFPRVLLAFAVFSCFLSGAPVKAEMMMADGFSVLKEPELPPPIDQAAVETVTPNVEVSANAGASTRAEDLLPQSDFLLGQPLPILQAQAPVEQPTAQTPNTDATSSTTGGRLDIPLGGGTGPLSFGFGSRIPDVSALVGGVTRERTVLSGSHQSSVIYITNYFKYRLSDRQTILLETAVDPHLFGFDLSFTNTTNRPDQGFAFNVFSQQSWVPVFRGGEREVNLPFADQTPWLYRLGAGIEYFQQLVPKLDFAAGLNYQMVSSRNAMFTSNIFPVDELGNPLTVNSNGQDSLLTFNLVAQYANLDNLSDPTQGTKIRVGVDQSIPVGSAGITYSRFAGNATQFIPLRLFPTKAPQVLIFNAQAGTIVGDVPPYDAFTLGGASSVRGYDKGDVGTGSSFVQLSTEYRVPLFSFEALKTKWNVRGAVFFDYANDLGTANDVIGIPAIVRDKPGNGLGYGLGLAFQSSFGLFRLELGFNDRGDTQFQFTVGDRY